MDPAWAARVRQRHHVQEHGAGPTLLYAHGFGCNQAVWERWLAEHLPHGRYALLDVAGHCAHMSHPERVADAMRRWLARGRTASTPSASTRS